MKDPELIVIAKNGLIRSAIKHMLISVEFSDSVEYKTDLSECINGKYQPKNLIIDATEITDPASYTLERLTQKNQKMSLLTLNSEVLDSASKVFVNYCIESDEDEDTMLEKFKDFLATSEKGNKIYESDNTLSDREREVVKLVALGRTNKEISDELHISPHTVITHRKNITSKLGIKTIAGLAVYAVLNGLINPEEVNR